MMDFAALFNLPTDTKATGKVAGQQGQAGSAASGREGFFAALMTMLGRDGTAAQGEGALADRIGGLIDEAEEALAVPDLSDAEITDILDTLVADLSGLLAAQPSLSADLSALLSSLTAEGEGAVEALPARLLAEALPALQQALAGTLSEDEAAQTPGLMPLLGRVAAQAEEATTGQVRPTVIFAAATGGPVHPAAPLTDPAQTAAATPIAGLAATTETAPQALLAQVQGQAAAHTAQPPVDPREVLGQIRAQATEEGRIKVELKPAGLGMVEIDLTADEAGKLRVVVRAENAAVLNALRGDREGMAAMLRDAGHSVDDATMSFGEFGQQDRGANGAGQGGWSPVLGDVTDTEAETDPAPMRARVTDGGVDITV
ncbi:flagellar hook-length control protein FliK [Pseudooceanicola sp. LIPI14-2-Ac024]|uniref:flagellar hook-length control protein FliK n=1 Tax=Pseudooceanicola sp. LIPI14-2-Ac024 TaxID=3344875 RepID=UPI0035D0FB17